MPRFRLSIGSGMVLVAILAFNFAVFGSAIRADGHLWANLIVAFGLLVGVQVFGLGAVIGLVAIFKAGREDLKELVPGVILFWALFLPCLAAVFSILTVGH